MIDVDEEIAEMINDDVETSEMNSSYHTILYARYYV